MEATYFGDGDVIICEDRHYPILVMTFFGAASVRGVRQHFRWMHEQADRALRERISLAVVMDSGLSGVPDAETRRVIADEATALNAKIPSALRWHTSVVVENRLIRGVLQTLSWLQGELSMEYAHSRAEAIESARAHCAKQGLALTTTPSVERPARPARQAR